MASPRIAILGALPFPHSQGSQVYIAQQARALRAAGAEITIVCYGASAPGPMPDGIDIVRSPEVLSPRGLRSGPSLGKPLADGGLVMALLHAHRRRAFTAVLAHNVEAAFIAIVAGAAARLPSIYVAHTLMAEELATYASPRLNRTLSRLGRRIDVACARRSDAVLAVSTHAAHALAAATARPVQVIWPGLDPASPPTSDVQSALCRKHGLEPGGYAVYAGNLDGYQTLEDLGEAARLDAPYPYVIVTHERERAGPRGVGVVRVASGDEARVLVHGAAMAILPRRKPGGFPIKLLNYMEARRAVIVRESLAEGLIHGVSAWVVPDARSGGEAIAEAVRALRADPELARGIGAGGRAHLETAHSWPALAAQTLALVDRVRPRASARMT